MIKTLNLNGHTSVSIDAAHVHIRNDGENNVCVSVNPNPVHGNDGVLTIPPGQAASLYNCTGTIYLDGYGPAVVVSSNYVTSPFKCAPTGSSGGGSDITTDAAGIVTLYDLQGGVPFSGITLSGDIVGQEITLRACGKNLISKPYSSAPGERGGIDFAVNGDGSVTMNGTAASTAFFKFTDIGGAFPAGTYTISGYANPNVYAYVNVYSVVDGTKKAMYSAAENGTTFTIDGSAPFSVMLVVNAGTVCENVTVFPQLERGSSATAFEPYSGSELKITPDSVPYTVPNDIRQQDGVNTVSVSAGDVIVEGVRRNAALGKVWAKLDSLM